MTDIDGLAEAWGIDAGYISETGEHRVISTDVKRAVLDAMGVDLEDPQPRPSDDAPLGQPMRCVLPSWLDEGCGWGVAVQLYSLRSNRNQGIGDFVDLARFAEEMARFGADFIGLNPLHALFWHEPERRSPYSPSSRAFLNPLYIAVDSFPGVDQSRAAELRAAQVVDYKGVADLKRKAFEQAFATADLTAPAFAEFCLAHGSALHRFALFEALSDALSSHRAGWSSWPPAYRHGKAPDVAAFARSHARAITFHKWLQWTASQQLAAAAETAGRAGMRIGLYVDLAVGVAPDGEATWADPDLITPHAHIGAPPDAFNHDGQDWGLAPMKPLALRARDLEPFKRDIEAAMRHAGAIRIDHVMGLQRLYWIPETLTAKSGAYVRYPMSAMLDAIGRASQERSCLVIGEDLGTVPHGFREILLARAINGTDVLYFERLQDGRFKSPSTYRRAALACLGTHDMPTLAGWWCGADIEARAALDSHPEGSEQHALAERERAKRLLIAALADEKLLSPDYVSQALADAAASSALPHEVAIAVHVFLARTRSRLVAISAEDLLAVVPQVNLPGTCDEYPNWMQKLPHPLEDMVSHPRCKALLEAVAAARPRT